MKVLLYDDTPAYLCHGGKQVHAYKMYTHLKALGIDVDYAKWWDPEQNVDLMHLFSCSPMIIRTAKQYGKKIVYTHLVEGLTNSTYIKRLLYRYRNLFIYNMLPKKDKLSGLFPWLIFPHIDAFVYTNKPDIKTANNIYSVASEKSFFIPHGCDREEMIKLKRGLKNRQSYLITFGSIIPRKNSIILAKAAVKAKVPVVFLGKPFSDKDPYYIEFCKYVDGVNVLHLGHLDREEMIKWIIEASGFVLLSKSESGCIAVHEASVAGLPMLLPDLPWAYSYGTNKMIQHVDINNEEMLINKLQELYYNSRRQESPIFSVMTWENVAKEYLKVYQHVLSS